MRRIGSRPLLAVLAAMFAVFSASPAWADSQIFINPGNLNVTAAEFADDQNPFKDCSPNQGGGPYVGYDVWVFNLPNVSGDAGVFTSVTATFEKPGGDSVTVTIPTDGGAIVLIGTSKAWIKLEAGWKLTAASAMITGTAQQFVLTHVCPAGTDPSSSPSPTPSGSGDPSPDPSSSVTPSVSQPPLPRTGAPIAAIFYVGLAAVVGGALVILLLHRKRDGLAAGPED